MTRKIRASRRRSQGEYALRSAFSAIGAGVRVGFRLSGQFLARVWLIIAPVVTTISPLGWIVLGAAVISLLVSMLVGWVEFNYLAFTLFGALLVSVPFVFGRAQFSVRVELDPRRVVAGERALGRIAVTNIGAAQSLPVRMELPVGDAVAEFVVPALPVNAEHDELFAVPTEHRGVINAGPAVSVRGDQLGLLRRTVRWTERIELFVHPRTVRIAASAPGLVRDLEGQVTTTITDNDISFHALRPYLPGDPLRSVHWRTSARTGQLMVRQFEETRRTQLMIVHSTERTHFASDEEFELAVSMTASLARQVISDGTALNIVTDERQLRTATPTAMLDDCSRLEGVSGRYASAREFVRDTTKRLAAPSVVMIVGGSLLPLAEYRMIQTLFSPETVTIAMRAASAQSAGIGKVGAMTMLTVSQLPELPALLRRIKR